MAVLVKGRSAEVTRQFIKDRMQEDAAKPENERKITTWTLKGNLLFFVDDNWGECGCFELANDFKTGDLKIGLHLAPEHYRKGPKYPELVGVLHGELVKLILNHFEELVDLTGPGISVVHSMYIQPER